MENRAFSDILQTILDLVQKLIAKYPSKMILNELQPKYVLKDYVNVEFKQQTYILKYNLKGEEGKEEEVPLPQSSFYSSSSYTERWMLKKRILVDMFTP